MTKPYVHDVAKHTAEVLAQHAEYEAAQAEADARAAAAAAPKAVASTATESQPAQKKTR